MVSDLVASIAFLVDEFQSALRFAVVSDVLVNGIMFVTFGFQSASRFAVLPDGGAKGPGGDSPPSFNPLRGSRWFQTEQHSCQAARVGNLFQSASRFAVVSDL